MATLALAQDNAFGQPLESQLRSCLLATWICDQAGYPDDVRRTTEAAGLPTDRFHVESFGW